jgi:hypothetical protein
MDKEIADKIFRERQSVEGRKGGNKTLEKYGKTHFSKIAIGRWKGKKGKKTTKKAPKQG